MDRVDIRGNDRVTGVEDKIVTKPSPKFLWLFRGVLYEYSVFDRFVLQDDLARVEAYYRDRGYYEARARAGRVFHDGPEHVRVEILVEEGKPALTDRPQLEGLPILPPLLPALVRVAISSALPEDQPFDADKLEEAKTAAKEVLTRRGYAYAEVEADAKVDLVTHRVTVHFRFESGPLCKYGPITIEGLGDLPEPITRRTLDLHEGDGFSSAELESAQQAALGLGVFASVDIRPQLRRGADGPDPRVPLHVKVEPSKLRAWRLGVGVEHDALKSDVHGLIGWEHHNFLGGLRTFAVTFRPGVVLYPIRIGVYKGPVRPLLEEKLKLELRQPAFVEARTTGFLTPQFNVFPLLLTPNPDPAQPVIGYAELQHASGVNRQFGRLFAELSHNIQVDVPVRYLAGSGAGRDRFDQLSTIVLSYPELRLQLDYRDDRVHPRKGFFLGNELQVAGLGGNAADVKVQPEARVYVPLHRRVVWASRGSVGFLFPFNYGGAIQNPRAGATPENATVEEVRDYQITFFRGFFSGGPSSNRGYAVRGVSPYALVPFLTPDAAASAAATCANATNAQEFAACPTPTGGFTLWELSTELRFQITKPLSVATFCDASDVSPFQHNLRFNYLHLSCGGGIRYDTPVGPLRVDLGVRIPGAQVLGVPNDKTDLYIPETFLGNLPLALAVGIGEAY